MKAMIDETELARLEYLIEASESYGYSTKSDDPNMQYLAAACHYTPALVAEVRRLREKVEAWEWYDECRRCVEWLDETYCSNDTFSEAESTYLAAREAVHADRE